MKMLLLNTSAGLKPMYDADYEEKKKLKIGQVYSVEIKQHRNPRFHRLYFALISCAWEYLPEEVQQHYGTSEGFRKTVEVAAGNYDLLWDLELNKFVHAPKSVSFASMDETAFKDLYDKVKDVIFSIIGRWVTPEEFDKNLVNF